MIIDETQLLKSMQSALPERFINQYGGAFANNQPVNKLAYVIFDASYPSWVEPCIEVLRLMNCRRALWSLPYVYGDCTIRTDCYPDGLKQVQEVAERIKSVVPNLGLHCLSFAVAPNSETAKDTRLLKFADGSLIKVGGCYLPNAELAIEIGQRLGKLFLDVGMTADGGVYWDGLDFMASGNITDTATGKPVCDAKEVILGFQNAFLRTVGSCPAEGSMPGPSQWFNLSHFQAWDYKPEKEPFKDFIDRHRVDKAKNSGTLVKHYGWWPIEKISVEDVLYGLHACEADEAIWSVFFRHGVELLKPEHREKLNLLRWWNERKETA